MSKSTLRRRKQPAPQPAPPTVRPDRGPWLWAGALFLGVFLLFASRSLLLGYPPLGGGDTIGTRLMPVSLLTQGNLDLDEFDFSPAPDLPYFLIPLNGRRYSVFPVGGALLLTPVYAAAHACGLDVMRYGRTQELLIGYTSSTICALAVVVVFLTYARGGRFRALVVALAFGLGTAVWGMCAEDVWQHTFGILFVSAALYLMERGADSPAYLGWIGLPAGLLFFVRPGNALIIAVLIGYVLLRQPRQIVRFALLAVPFLVGTLAYNLLVMGHLFGAYNDEATGIRPLANLTTGLTGLLVSPSRGLLVHSPFVLLGLLAPWWRDDGRRGLRAALALMIVAQVLMYGSYWHWYGGHCFGPRFLLEVMPACAALLWHAWPACTANLAGRFVVGAAVTWSVATGAAGYVFDWTVWNSHPDVDRCTARLWDWRDNVVATGLWGLPARCTHPVGPGPINFQTHGVGLELGRGWTQYHLPNPWAMGEEAEMILHFSGQPVTRLDLSLWALEGLPQAQHVTARMNGRVCAEASLSAAGATTLVVPVSDADRAGGKGRLTLHFTSWRRIWPDIRPLSAELVGMKAHFAGPTSPPAPAVSAAP